MKTANEGEIIDLTGSSPHPGRKVVDLSLSEDDDPAVPNSAVASSAKKKSRKRRKKKPKSGEISTADATREPSVEPTPERSSAKSNGEGASTRQQNVSPQHQPPETKNDSEQLFYVDISPVSVPPLLEESQLASRLKQVREPGPSSNQLLLPTHVSVLGCGPSLIPLASQKELEENDYIEYLDYDERIDTPRYFEEKRKDETKTSRLICKHCGAEGDHKASACTVIICLTCGARDEHSTRSCPVSKTCFTCGMKGHINATCPNRYTSRTRDFDRYSDCERCHSALHQTNECPSWWRLYEYITDEERARVVEAREETKGLASSGGGEAYIRDDPWCYNCASVGHWGDDCDEIPHRYDRPEEPSAFSLHNIQSGPFYDPEKETTVEPKQSRNRRQSDDYFDDKAWAKGIPGEVGKQGRKKNMARLEKRVREQEQEDDDGWFGRSADLRIRGEAKRGDTKEKGPERASKMNFGRSVTDAGKRFGFENSKPPSLLARISKGRSEDVRPRGSRDRREERGDSFVRDSRDDWNGRDRRGGDRDRDRDYERRRDKDRNRPRYSGGYAR